MAYLPLTYIAPPGFDRSTHQLSPLSDLIVNGEVITGRYAVIEIVSGFLAPQTADVSKLTLMRRLDDLGKWGAFKTLLSQLPEIVQDAWTLAQSIRADDPLFAENAPTIKNYLGLTDEEFASLLA